MPAFLVTFDQPVTYQSGHPRGERLITELPVRAPDAAHASAHAIRTTLGGIVQSVVEVEDFLGPPPSIEAIEEDLVKAVPRGIATQT